MYLQDAELYRLRSARDAAKQRQQTAWQTQQSAYERRSSANAIMNQAYEAQQTAYANQQAAWDTYMSVKQANGPRIDSLNSQQERAYHNMVSAFESASSAYYARDGANARIYADQGHAYKAESQACVTERRQLVAKIRTAREQFEAVRPAFQRAKSEYTQARQEFLSAKAEHERAQAEFNKAKAEFDDCAKAFKDRLDELKSAHRKRRKEKKSIAEKAGVPLEYRDDVWISKESDGNTNIYFGGLGKPDGPGHGHYVMDQNGNVTYRREPFDPHGAQNFEETRREKATLRMAQIAINQWARSAATPRVLQSEDSDFKVSVKSGYDRDHDAIVSDIVIIDWYNKKEHYHIVIDEHGNELFSEWRANPTKKKKP